MVNQQLCDVVGQLCHEIIQDFEADGVDLNSASFLSNFSYKFLGHESPERCERVLRAAFAPEHRVEAEKAVEAAYSEWGVP